MRMRVLSGMRPSGRLHLGNLLGALDNWRRMQDEYECFYFIADWHALTTDYEEPSHIREYTYDIAVDWLASGLDPERATLFVQSWVPEHAVLHLLLSMVTPLAWLERNPTFKEQLRELRDRELHTYGFIGYPVLQAADILIYKAHFVPVGVDQLPHLELGREIARRFNHLYNTEVFRVPEPKLTEYPKLPGIDGRKMSKSYDNAIYLSDPPEAIGKKVRRMLTDPARARRQDPGNPDVCPVFQFHKIYSDEGTIHSVDRDCRTAGIGCVDCKNMLADTMLKVMEPYYQRRAVLAEMRGHAEEVLREGSRKAAAVARQTLGEVHEAMRLVDVPTVRSE